MPNITHKWSIDEQISNWFEQGVVADDAAAAVVVELVEAEKTERKESR